MYVVRNPEEGIFGTVTVQFTITDSNGSLAEGDLRPAQGFVVLEDGVRLKVSENSLGVSMFRVTSVMRKHVTVLNQFSLSSELKASKRYAL